MESQTGDRKAEAETSPKVAGTGETPLKKQPRHFDRGAKRGADKPAVALRSFLKQILVQNSRRIAV